MQPRPAPVPAVLRIVARVLAALAAASIGCGDDGSGTPDDGGSGEIDGATCDPTACDASCVAGGAVAGVCRATGCECIGGADGDADRDGDADSDAGPDVIEDVVPDRGDDAGAGDATDAEAETGPTDADGDTYPEDVDCDDHDADVFPGSVRECTSACGTGTERCDAGSWVGCTAPTDCTCSTPGATRLVECGRCGQASQRCGSDGVWEMPGTCMYEGECYAGETATEPCGFCGERSRLCSAACAWMPWEECRHPGECDPSHGDPVLTGDGCPLGQFQRRFCSALTCAWETITPCGVDEVPCTPPRRTGGYDEEICIPGGPFLMGTDIPRFVESDNTPVRAVYLAPFYIDKYMVTNARYRSCVAAGACTPPTEDLSAGLQTYFATPESTYANYPVVGVNRAQTLAFCAWDGGRTLPTEAQFEKAAKGPAPRQVPYPWGTDDTNICLYTSLLAVCHGPPFTYPVDAFPLGVSYYGVFQMHGHLFQWTRDWYQADWYSRLPEIDPEQTVPTPETVSRSIPATADQLYSIAHRVPGPPELGGYGDAFRCARPGL